MHLDILNFISARWPMSLVFCWNARFPAADGIEVILPAVSSGTMPSWLHVPRSIFHDVLAGKLRCHPKITRSFYALASLSFRRNRPAFLNAPATGFLLSTASRRPRPCFVCGRVPAISSYRFASIWQVPRQRSQSAPTLASRYSCTPANIRRHYATKSLRHCRVTSLDVVRDCRAR